jgi:hypothetical protein
MREPRVASGSSGKPEVEIASELPVNQVRLASRLLYDSEQNPSRDRAGVALRFNIPTVVNGHVYVGAKHEVDVYGLLAQMTAGNVP